MEKTMRNGLLFAVVMACSLFAGQKAFAQDSYSGIYPDFSVNLDFSSGLKNLDDNKEIDAVPGVSSDYNADLNLLLKGKFKRFSEWGVEKEDGIEYKSALGYEASMTMNLAKLYASADTSSSYSTSSDTNHYSLIQPMIDWYEKNMSRYGLPFDPCGVGTAWPTTTYGASSTRYQFIKGSTVENASDVNWTTQKWADAEALYQELKYSINNALNHLHTDFLPTGDVSQVSYASMNDSQKKLAELKMKAKREFSDVYNGKKTTSGNSILDAIDSAYIKITNIGGVVDSRVDFMGKRLSVGNSLYSLLAGQTTDGSAVTLSMKQGLVEGLEASLGTGIAGGVKQKTENFDTSSLDYYRGISAEWAVKADAKYTKYFEKFNGTASAFGQFILSDLMEANKNFALDGGVNYKSNTFISWGAGVEGMFLNWKDREDDNDDYNKAYAIAANASAGAFGATLNFNGQYKSDRFSHPLYSSTQDRFYGYSADSDYYIANLESAAKFTVSLDFNPQYFIGYDIVGITGGVNGFLYGDSLEMNGIGFFADLMVGLEDLINLPVTVSAGMDYYKNSELTEWADYSSLPGQDFVEFTTFKAGISYAPVKYLELSAEYASIPSYSRRNTDRTASFTLNGKIKFD